MQDEKEFESYVRFSNNNFQRFRIKVRPVFEVKYALVDGKGNKISTEITFTAEASDIDEAYRKSCHYIDNIDDFRSTDDVTTYVDEVNL